MPEALLDSMVRSVGRACAGHSASRESVGRASSNWVTGRAGASGSWLIGRLGGRSSRRAAASSRRAATSGSRKLAGRPCVRVEESKGSIVNTRTANKDKTRKRKQAVRFVNERLNEEKKVLYTSPLNQSTMPRNTHTVTVHPSDSNPSLPPCDRGYKP